MRVIAWVAYATLFILLFGLAANNQHEAVVKGFFGAEWRAPVIVVVLLCFAAGALLTLASLLPALLRRGGARAASARKVPATGAEVPAPTGNAAMSARPPTASKAVASTPGVTGHPPRDGL